MSSGVLFQYRCCRSGKSTNDPSAGSCLLNSVNEAAALPLLTHQVSPDAGDIAQHRA